MNIKQALDVTINHQDLSTEQMISVMRQILLGEATAAHIGGFLVALRMQGESLDELEGATLVMRALSLIHLGRFPRSDSCRFLK